MSTLLALSDIFEKINLDASDPIQWMVWGALNLVTFLMFGLDKWRAKRGATRTPEAHLILLSLLGGCLGGWLGMSVFRHKTKKVSFQAKMVLATAVFCAFVWACLWY